MIGLEPILEEKRPLQVLCLGAHSDDIEIGCGGSILTLKQGYQELSLTWVVFSATGIRMAEADSCARRFTAGCDTDLILKEFRDGFMPYSGAQVKDFFEDLHTRVEPDLVFTHWSGDAHQDHRLLSELAGNTFRNNLILEYEIPKYDGDMGRPNFYVPLSAEACQEKVTALLDEFQSQRGKRWFDRETFLGLMRLRGMECNAPSGYAEAFYARKLVLQPADMRRPKC